jgi:hypothetical protein
MSVERGPRFAPAESEGAGRRIRRIEDWAGRHDQWATQRTAAHMPSASMDGLSCAGCQSNVHFVIPCQNLRLSKQNLIACDYADDQAPLA